MANDLIHAIALRTYHASRTVPLLRDILRVAHNGYRAARGRPAIDDGAATAPAPSLRDILNHLHARALEREIGSAAAGKHAGGIAALDDPSLPPGFAALVAKYTAAGKVDLVTEFVRATLPARNLGRQFELVRELQLSGQRQAALDWAGTIDLSIDGVPRHDFDADEKVIWSVVASLAIATPELIATLVRSTRHILTHAIPGAFVECGVFRGGSTMAMMLALQSHGATARDFYLYDTFAGMPLPDERDVYYDGRSAREEWEEKRTPDGRSGWVVSSLPTTRANIATLGYPDDRVHYVEGLVEQTIPGRAPAQIAMLRLDTDFYTSTRHELDHLYPRLSSGGVLIIDDYGAFQGAQQAVDEYLAERGIHQYLNRVDANVRLMIKP
jgi:hypothetical protein